MWREGNAGRKLVLENVHLAIAPGERVFLLGPNGAGKTSLLLALVGAASSEGIIRIGSSRLDERSLRDVRRRVAFVFADPGDQLFTAEVAEEVAFGPKQRGLDDATVAARVARALGAVGLAEQIGRAPSELSLGEQRRLAVATALAIEPEVLLLDEPTAALDPRARSALLDVIRELPATVVIATHDLDAALTLGGRAVLVQGGHVVGDGPCAELLTNEAVLDAAGLALPLAVAARR